VVARVPRDVAWDHGHVQLTRLVRRLAGIITALFVGLLAALPAAAHGAVPEDPPDAGAILLRWEVEPALALALLGTAVFWWRLLASVDRAHPENVVPARQRWAFFAGLAAVAVALLSGVARYDTTLFSVHMVQHLLLTLVAPPLIVLGAPITQVLRASSPETRQRVLLPILHSRVVSVLTHPIVAWLIFTAVMWGSHFSPLFDRSLEDRLIHDLEHGLFLASGLLFWGPLVAVDPAPGRMGYPARIGYVFLQMPQNSFLAIAILFAASPLYPHYVTLGAPYGIDALSDQRLAAGIMWFFGDVIFLIATLAVLAGWMRAEERSTAAADRRADAERAALRDREAALLQLESTEAADQAGSGVSTRDR
jgi:cytochrome c oxidase assembly factor CtaG